RAGIADLDAPVPQLGDGGVEIVDQQGEVLPEPGWRLAFDEVQLLRPGVEPGAADADVGAVGPLLQTEDVGVEAQRLVDVGNHDRHVMHGQWSHAPRIGPCERCFSRTSTAPTAWRSPTWRRRRRTA